MVHDPRINSLMARLGGLYRDPIRVDRDASSLLKSSVGEHLAPGIAPLVENNGEVLHCLVLQGTIAMHFRGTTYQLLVDLYLPPGFPHRPPVAFVRLTGNMYLKENHMHVGSDGKVYLPYLHEWDPRTHNLIELVVAMSSVFSNDPPVYSRPTPPAPTAGTGSSTTAATNTSLPPPPQSPPPPDLPPPAFDAVHNSTSLPPPPLPPSFGSDAEAILAREAEEANAVAEAARKAEKEENERNEQMAAQKQWEEKRKNEIKDQVIQKIIKHLGEATIQSKNRALEYQRDQRKLQIAEEKLTQQLEIYEKAKVSLTNQISVVEEKTIDIQAWLEENNDNDNNTNGSKQKTTTNVDELVQPKTPVHEQMLDLAAENASLTDALYFLDRCLYLGNVDCDTHLKQVRRLAKRQFLVRAHLIKINQHLLKHSPPMELAGGVGGTASF